MILMEVGYRKKTRLLDYDTSNTCYTGMRNVTHCKRVQCYTYPLTHPRQLYQLCNTACKIALIPDPLLQLLYNI